VQRYDLTSFMPKRCDFGRFHVDIIWSTYYFSSPNYVVFRPAVYLFDPGAPRIRFNIEDLSALPVTACSWLD